MNGYENGIVDTNIIFMALYDKSSKAAKVIEAALQGKIELFSPDSVKEEIIKVLRKELYYSDEEIKTTLDSIPITFIEKEIYSDNINKTKVKHKADKPIDALAITLNCGIFSADRHFENNPRIIDINKFLSKLKQ